MVINVDLTEDEVKRLAKIVPKLGWPLDEATRDAACKLVIGLEEAAGKYDKKIPWDVTGWHPDDEGHG